MNTLKPLLTVAVLAGIGYGVYVRINSGADAPPPSGVATGWDTTPKVQLGDATAPGGAPAWGPPGVSNGSQLAPPFGAPRNGGQAPMFNPPSTAGPAGAAPPGAVTNAPPYSPTDVSGQFPPANPTAVPPASSDPIPPLPPSGNPYASFPPQSGGPSPGNSASDSSPAPPVATLQQDNTSPAGSSAPPYSPPGVAPANAPPYTVPAVSGGPAYSAPPSSVAPPYAVPPGSSPPPAGVAVTEPGAEARSANATVNVSPVPPGVVVNYAAVIEVAKRELEAGQIASALRQLSKCYDSPQLSPMEQQQLLPLLDQVAGTVVYSTQHLLEAPYEVQPGERLEDIAQRYNVPWQLLAKINGIDDPQSLRPGERMKVVRGPFSAVVSLDKKQLTLLLADGSYAGRFNIGIGREQPPREGVFAVSDKVVNPVYHGRDRAIGADDVNNPYGERWIGLGNDLGIHGTDRPENVGRTDLAGSISLSPHDAEDVFDILSLGSKVTIRR